MLRKSFTVNILTTTLVVLFIFGCSSSPSADEKTEQTEYEVSEDKSSLAKLYELEHMKEWYPKRVLPPKFNYDIDLSNKNIVALSFLRNEIFARNGYLFEDAVLRGYFNQFAWYQPVFEVEGFKVQLNKEEQAFVEKVRKQESVLMKGRYVTKGKYELIGMDHVYNLIQFKNIGDNLKLALAEKNFAIVPASHDQLFHVYDENHYQYVPNFITTDLILQVMHKHFSMTLKRVEQEKFIPLLTELLGSLKTRSGKVASTISDAKLKKAADWTDTYLAIANGLLTGTAQGVQSPDGYAEEISKIKEASGTGSKFLQSELINYAQFKPRGNYTESEELERYFRCVKWLNTAPMYIDDDERFLSAVMLAEYIKGHPKSLELFERYNKGIKFIVGDEDNLSIADVIACLPEGETVQTDPDKLKTLREKVIAREKNRIIVKGGDAATQKLVSNRAILFTAGRYTFDAEILSRLIHVLRPEPKRVFPKGLDVFAALGDAHAENILLDELKEGSRWSAYPDSLRVLKNEFSSYKDWDKNIYTKTFEAIHAINNQQDDYPRFMKTHYWGKKNLNTALSAWTELKHDMLLYAEQPGGAQAGEGGGPPPPQHISYVEPNVVFWEKAIALIDFQKSTLEKLSLLDERTSGIADDLKEIVVGLLDTSKKELKGEMLTNEEFDKLSWIGGSIEYLTLRIFGGSIFPEQERVIAVVADVYNYNGEFLEEGVGMADEIYVVVEINGKPYLSRGAVFSYFEFTSGSPMTDEAWKEKVSAGKSPERPEWMKEIIIKSPSLESKKDYSF